MRRVRALPAAWLMLLLAAPLAAWLLGARQPLLENRSAAPFPPLNRDSLRDPETFTRLDTALLDRLPFRGTAIALRTRVELDLFRDSPNPQIALGDDGWLYFVPELGPCTAGGEPTADPADAWEVLARTFAAAGYRPIVLSAGSKLLTHTRDAPELEANATRCLEALERRVAQRLARTPGGLTIDAALRAVEARGEPVFLRFDSHWNWRGRELFVRRVLDRIRPGLARAADLRPGNPYEHAGDLATLLGVTRTEPDRALATAAPQRPPAPGDVVLIGDSQLENALLTSSDPATPPVRDRVLPDQPSCDWSQVGAGACDAPLRAARTVVIEQVARDARLLTSLCWDPLAVAAERLRGWRRVTWERLEDVPRATAGPLTIPDSGVLSARIRPSGRDVGTAPRLLRLTVLHAVAGADGTPTPIELTQHPTAGVAGPCATPAQATIGGPLLLAVPAGRRASELVLELRSAPGSRLGRPEEIVLDGHVRTARR